ncbi:MAG: hypothetical protein HQK89_02100 [Nitrospirae bacterium]|nr:hypothetical protein [Nitrospirota bacterium]
MNDSILTPSFTETLYLLFTINSATFAVDMEQVAEIATINDIKHAPVCFHWFHDIIGSETNVTAYNYPRALVVKHKQPQTAIIIEEPKDTVYIPLESMREMPGLVTRFTNVIWGAAFIGGKPVYLTDLYKIDIFSEL